MQRQEVIDWLKANGYPALPVAPIQPADKYPAREKDGSIKRDKAGNPVPTFTGKNPSYLDQNGIPHLLNHRKYQSQLPSDHELREWFANPDNGVGTLGGWNNTIWLDLDVKQFASKEECASAFWEMLNAHQELAQTFLEESHSGGWRIGVKVKQKPNFTNFALTPGGAHVGEALGEGRFTVLAPTIGVSGNPYQSINRVVPVEVISLDSIGVYSISTKTQRQVPTAPHPAISYIPGNIPLELLGSDASRKILGGSCPTGDRSEALTTALNEWYGWQNWTQDNSIAVSGTPEELAYCAGEKLGVDLDRVDRIVKTIDIVSCNPAALHRGDEVSCWKKICKLDKVSFEAKCPTHIKEAIKAEWQRTFSQPGGSDGSTRGARLDGGDGEKRRNSTNHSRTSLREVIEKASHILETQINSPLDSIEANILLEELRREAGVNEYNWEHKYLKPLREKLERSLALPVAVNQPTAQTDPSERLKLDLLALTKETDPIKKVRKRAEIASHYRISKGEIEFLCHTLEGDSKTPKAQFYALNDFLSMESEGIDYLIPGLLPRGETVLCSGLPKSGKTLLAIDAAFAIATGESHFLGEEVKQGKVLLVSVDESPQSTRAKLLKRGFRSTDAANIAVMTAWDISQLDGLEAKLQDFRPNVVVIDSLKRITAGREISENSAEFADIIYTLKELLTKYNAAGILIHHSNKNPEATGVSRVRGSTAIAGAVWGIWQMDIPESEAEAHGKPSKSKSKQKRFDPTNPHRVFTAICRDTEGALLNIRFNPENHSYSISEGDKSAQSERKTQEQIILDILTQVAPKGLTGREIMDYSGLSRSVYSVLDRMVSKRSITHRQSKTDSRMTVYCLPNFKGTHTPPQSHQDCDQYSSKPPSVEGERIDHKLITSPPNLITNFCEDDSKNVDVIKSKLESETDSVEIDHRNTSKGGEGVSPNPVAQVNNSSITSEQYSDIPDPWTEKYTKVNVDDDGWGEIVRVSPQQLTDSSNMAIPNSSPLPQKPSIEVADSTAVEDAIASPTPEIWVWSRETGECLGQVLYDGGNRLKIRRSGEPASRAKWHTRNQITFENPTVSALSLNTSATTPVQWEDDKQFLEELDD
jgi:hypothetical protein